jgi:hypothetical protein
MQKFLSSNPLPPTGKDLLGSIRHPPAGSANIAASGGTGASTQFSMDLSGSNGKVTMGAGVSGNSAQDANQSIRGSFGFRF